MRLHPTLFHKYLYTHTPSWHHFCTETNFIPTAANHQTQASPPASQSDFPWSCPAAENIFLPLRPERCLDHTSLFTELSASHSVLTRTTHTDRSGVERGSPEGRARPNDTVETRGAVWARRQTVKSEVWGCEECEEGGVKACTQQTPTAASQGGNESWC